MQGMLPSTYDQCDQAVVAYNGQSRVNITIDQDITGTACAAFFWTGPDEESLATVVRVLFRWEAVLALQTFSAGAHM